jgi:hypothetical protein
MGVASTSEALAAAAEAMFRLRAVESPMDTATRLRTVWHHGARDAELVSLLDEAGTCVRHELRLLEEVCIWEREVGFSTGARAGGALRRDDSPRAEVLERARAVLDRYGGADGVLLHLRQRLRDRHPGPARYGLAPLQEKERLLRGAVVVVAVTWLLLIPLGMVVILVAYLSRR